MPCQRQSLGDVADCRVKDRFPGSVTCGVPGRVREQGGRFMIFHLREELGPGICRHSTGRLGGTASPFIGADPRFAGEIRPNPSNKKYSDNIPPCIIMNPNQPQPLSQAEDEPRIRDYLGATALVVGACASIAIAFTAIGTCYAADAAIKRIFRKGVRHAPM